MEKGRIDAALLLLPDLYSLVFGFVILITGLYVKCLIELGPAHQRAIHPPHGRRMRIGIHIGAQERIPCFHPPDPCNG